MAGSGAANASRLADSLTGTYGQKIAGEILVYNAGISSE